MRKKKSSLVYLDYAATTPVYPEVIKAMAPYWREKFGNPSSVHRWGEEGRVAVDEARRKVAEILGAKEEEIIFTGTTTTADNLAIQGVVRAAGEKKGRIITSAVEHHAVLDTVKAMEKEGWETVFLPVDKNGVVSLAALDEALTRETVLVSVMYVNNEVGTIEPIREISRLIREKERKWGKRIYFHTDAAAAVGWVEVDVSFLGVDLLSLGGHKFGGPKGVGVLYRKSDVSLAPLTFGGHHEFGFWPGTEPVPLIVGLAEALRITLKQAKEKRERIRRLQKRLIKGILEQVPGSFLTGHPEKRVPDIASFVIEGVEGEAMLLLLSDKGVAASSGSACTSGELKPSHVLLAMGIPPEKAHGSIRFSLGWETTKEEIDYLLEVFPPIVAKLRRLRKGIN